MRLEEGRHVLRRGRPGVASAAAAAAGAVERFEREEHLLEARFRRVLVVFVAGVLDEDFDKGLLDLLYEL